MIEGAKHWELPASYQTLLEAYPITDGTLGRLNSGAFELRAAIFEFYGQAAARSIRSH